MDDAISLPKPPPRLDAQKFRDPLVTAKGEIRAHVALKELRTLWINTGTLCNLTCAHCYIESSPSNDRLAYITAAEVADYFDEIAQQNLGTREIGFTGGEPFLNPDIIAMIKDALARGFQVLVLTNAMKPMMNRKRGLLALRQKYGDRLTIRVSLDHYEPVLHELERGPKTFQRTLDGLRWLAQNGFRVHVAARTAWAESVDELRRGFGRLFEDTGIAIDSRDPQALVLFPEMDAGADVPEITENCWNILHVNPDDLMCAHSRMVVKRKDAARPSVLACTLIAYDPRFELGTTLKEAAGAVSLNHPHCARFCVLGGASCSHP